MTVKEVIKICEDYFPKIGWLSLSKDELYFGGEDGLDQLEFLNDHTLERFGAGKLDFSNITEDDLVNWLINVGMNCIKDLDGINTIIQKPENGKEIIVLGYELNSRIISGKYIKPGEYKVVKFEDMSQYSIIIENDTISWVEKVS